MRFCVLTLVTTAFLLSGCDSNESPEPGELVGTWQASRFEYVNPNNMSQKIDLIALGGTFTIVVNTNMSYQATLTFPGQPSDVSTGTLSASMDVLTVSEDGVSFDMQFDMTLSGNTLTLSNGGAEFDFDDDGTEDQARLSMTLVRAN